MTVERKMPAKVRERLPFGWTPSPAYPGRLGVAGSMLIVIGKARCQFKALYSGAGYHVTSSSQVVLLAELCRFAGWFCQTAIAQASVQNLAKLKVAEIHEN